MTSNWQESSLPTSLELVTQMMSDENQSTNQLSTDSTFETSNTEQQFISSISTVAETAETTDEPQTILETSTQFGKSPSIIVWKSKY